MGAIEGDRGMLQLQIRSSVAAAFSDAIRFKRPDIRRDPCRIYHD